MKKLLIALLVMGLSLPSFAEIKEKDVIGTWKYKVETGMETLTGTLVIKQVDGKLVGNVDTDDGAYVTMNKIEIRDNDVLYFEVDTDYETLKITVTVTKNAFTGTISSQDGDMPITGEKTE
jgi:hypothetical protein